MRANQSKLSNFYNIVLAFTALYFAVFPNQTMGSEVELEYAKKAKIIQYIIGEVVWPKNSIKNNSINLCILGKFPYMKAIDDINGKRVKNYKVNVKEITSIQNAENHCQIIYISKSESSNLNKIMNAFAKHPVLLLGDMDNFAKNGGSMNFILLNNVVAITVNLDTLKSSNLDFELKNVDQLTVIPEKADLSPNNN